MRTFWAQSCLKNREACPSDRNSWPEIVLDLEVKKWLHSGCIDPAVSRQIIKEHPWQIGLTNLMLIILGKTLQIDAECGDVRHLKLWCFGSCTTEMPS